MKSHELLDAIGEAQDMYVLDAKASKKKHTSAWAKWVAVAACLCVLIVGGSVIAPLLNGGGHWNGEKPQKVYLVGAVLQTGNGTLTYHTDNFDEHNLAFTISLNRDIGYSCAVFNGYNILEEWTDENGVLHQETEMFKVITPCGDYETSMDYTVIDDILKITVNGQEVNTLPHTAGTYEVIIDYSEMYQHMDEVNTSVELWPFGEIIIDSERFIRSLNETE